MSLNTALSGINAAQAALNVTSNDLANTNTTGFRSGTQLFDDIFPANGNQDAAGIGVRAGAIERNFQQGGVETTNNPLDAAIQGNGFFVVSNNGVQQYTRDGHFHLDPVTGDLMDSNGDVVQGYIQTAAGRSANLSAVTVDAGNMAATPTSREALQVGLNTGDPAIPAATPFSVTNPTSFDESTSVSAYDSLGNANHVQLYFRRAAGTGSPTAPDSWQVYAQPESSTGNVIGTPSLLTTLTFNSNGKLTGGATANLTAAWGNGAGNATIAFDFTGSTLANQAFAVGAVQGNGFPPGTYEGVSIAKDGSIQATYSNGKKAPVGQIALATFANKQGLAPASNNLYSATTASGQAVVNAPGSGQTGSLAAGQLEQSNVDLSRQLVNLITEQQAYQANTKSISTSKQDVGSLMHI